MQGGLSMNVADLLTDILVELRELRELITTINQPDSYN
jgi:hypothetical protein